MAINKHFKATKRSETYFYDTEEDLKLHMLYMKRKGYSVISYSITDLYTEFEVYDVVDGNVSIDHDGDEDFV